MFLKHRFLAFSDKISDTRSRDKILVIDLNYQNSIEHITIFVDINCLLMNYFALFLKNLLNIETRL